MKRRLLWIVAIVVVAGAITGGYLYTQGIGARPAFRTVAVTRGPLTAAVSATGTLNAVITVQVGSQVSGQVKELHADFNSLVKKDQVIARIDPDTFEAKVNQTKAQVDAARASVLNQQAAVEKTRADLENARAALAAARAQTAKSQVTVVDSNRTLGRNRDLRQRGLIAQADEDTAQATYDSAVAQLEASKAQERAQGSAVTAAEAQLRVAEAMLKNAVAQVAQNEAAQRQAQVDLDHTFIRAPVDGVVVGRTVHAHGTIVGRRAATAGKAATRQERVAWHGNVRRPAGAGGRPAHERRLWPFQTEPCRHHPCRSAQRRRYCGQYGGHQFEGLRALRVGSSARIVRRGQGKMGTVLATRHQGSRVRKKSGGCRLVSRGGAD